MNNYIDQQIRLILKDALPDDRTTSIPEPANQNEKPKDKKSRHKLKRNLLFSLGIIFIFLSGVSSRELITQNNISIIITKTPAEIHYSLSEDDLNMFKSLVKKVALSEGKTTRKIHKELQYVFNYQSYKRLDYVTFNKLCDFLKIRLN